MLLILEIVLTVIAWKKGWKWKSLLPMALTLFIGFVIGLSGPTDYSGVILIDIGAIISLIIMLANPPKKSNDIKV